MEIQNETPYNRLVLIGNGFDVALGLQTSYTDFILDYIKSGCINAIENKIDKTCDKELMNFIYKNNINISVEKLRKFNDVNKLLEYTTNKFYIDYKIGFTRYIVNELINKRWVDIEQSYYDDLLRFFKVYVRRNIADKNIILEQIRSLNTAMETITDELKKYLIKQQNHFQINYLESPSTNIIYKTIEPLSKDVAALVSKHNRHNPPHKVLFLNFNYTNILNILLNISSVQEKPIFLQIHGDVNDILNPIIFGYGDDTGDEYKELENANEMELLKKIKSFQYPSTHNYHKLLNFIESEDFDVFVIGHSCGLSDRTLLKTIFEHKNCLAIQIFHYKQPENEAKQEHFEKRIEISRHFSDKVLMRERILPFDPFCHIPQTKKE